MEKFKKNIVELNKSGKFTDLEVLLCKNVKETLNIIKKLLVIKDGPFLLNGILKSLECKSPESTSLKSKIYEYILKLIKSYEDTDDKENGKLVSILVVHTESLPNKELMHLIDFYMEHLQSNLAFYGRWTELLSKLLATAISREELLVNGQRMTGEDFRYHILKKICGYDWNAQTAITLLPIIKEMNLPPEELKDVIEKIREVLQKVDYQSVPPIVYHMILLCQDTLPSLVLEELINFFNEQEIKMRSELENDDDDSISVRTSDKIDGQTMDQLIEARCTVVHHITDLAKYDARLTRDYLKIIKCSWLPQRIFTTFNLSLALSLVHIDRYKDNIIDSLKSCILKNYKLEEKRQKSLWLTEVFKDQVNLLEVFRSTVRSCKGSWDQVSEGVILLCFSLLESVGLKGETYPIQQKIALASAIMPVVFKKEVHLVPDIIKQISCCILTISSSLHYVELLGRLIKTSTTFFLDHIDLIRELLEQLAFLPLRVGTMLLGVLLPLFKISMNLKDSLIIILRKLLFSRQIENREIAVLGILQILRHFRVMGALPSSQASMSFSSTLSQISADIHTNINNNTNEALCLELLGILRRCFTQQHEIRSTLYSGLCNVCKANHKLVPNILQLLNQHLSNFLDKNEETLNPLLLSKVVSTQGETVTLVEPLGELLACLSECKSWYENDRAKRSHRNEDVDEEDEIISVLSDTNNTFDILTEKLAHCDMDDLDLNSKSFVPNTAAGRQGLFQAEVIFGVYDGLIHQNFCRGALESVEKMKTVLALFKTQKRVLDLVKEKSKTTGKKGEGSKGKSKSSSTRHVISFKSNLSLDVTVQLLKFSFSDVEDDSDCASSLEIIKDNYDLQMYLLDVIEQNLASLKSVLPINREKYLPDLKTASRILLKVCVNNVPEDEDNDKEVSKFRQCLVAFHSILEAFIKYFKDKLPQILKEMTGKSASKEYGSLLYFVAKSCLNTLLNLLRKENQGSIAKDATLLIQIIGLLTKQMELNSKRINELQSSLDQICKDITVYQNTVSESLVVLLLSITEKCKVKCNLIRSLGREVHFHLGDIEQDVVLEATSTYKIVTEKTASAVLLSVCSYCDETISVLETSLFKLKESLMAGEKYDEEIDKMLSYKFAVIVQCLHEIFQSGVPCGLPQVTVLRTTTKFYCGMSTFVKYYLEYYKVKKNAKISEHFQKLVQVCSNMLKENSYKMITYVDSSQKEAGKKKNENLKARANKECKLIPSLIYAMEDYEKLLLQLDKKSNVNLLSGTKITTSRDFRIRNDALEKAMRKSEEDKSDEEREEAQEEGNSDNERSKQDTEDEREDRSDEDSPPKKKRKSK